MWSGVNSIQLVILDWLLNVDWACSKAVLHGTHNKKVRCHHRNRLIQEARKPCSAKFCTGSSSYLKDNEKKKKKSYSVSRVKAISSDARKSTTARRKK